MRKIGQREIHRTTRRRLFGLGGMATAALLANPPVAEAGSGTLAPTPVKSGDYTAAPEDLVPVDASSGSVTVTLPAEPVDQTQVGIGIIAVGVPYLVTVACGKGDVLNEIGGPTSMSLASLNQGVVLQYDTSGKIWYQVASATPLAVPKGAAQLGSDSTLAGPGGSRLNTDALVSHVLAVTPEQYGAVGDGSTDDTLALQDAFTSGFNV